MLRQWVRSGPGGYGSRRRGALGAVTAVEALLDAIERGDETAVRALAAGPAVRAAFDSDIGTRLEVLSCMAVSGCPELAAEASTTIRTEPNLAVTRFSGGQTLLHRAARGWNAAFAELLLDLGADPNARDTAGHPPLYHAGNRFPRPAAAPP